MNKQQIELIKKTIRRLSEENRRKEKWISQEIQEKKEGYQDLVAIEVWKKEVEETQLEIGVLEKIVKLLSE